MWTQIVALGFHDVHYCEELTYHIPQLVLCSLFFKHFNYSQKHFQYSNPPVNFQFDGWPLGP